MIKFLFSQIKSAKRNYQWKRQNIRVAKGSFVDFGTSIGKGTRINNASHIGCCEIGCYCAIGGRLVVRSSNHNIGYLNMQDHLQKNVLKSAVNVAGISKGKVKIGHGVWIGDSVIVLPGASIGNGAVIGAGSVVTEPIPDFAIAVGNPARVIKYRFSEEVINELKSIDWWTWSESTMKSRIRLFELDLANTDLETLKLLIEELTH